MTTFVGQNPAVLVGVNPTGKVAGVIDTASAPGPAFRSPDSATLMVVGRDQLTLYSSLDGSRTGVFARQPAGFLIDAAMSADGKWAALLGDCGCIQIIELRSGGVSQVTPLASDPKAATPGLTTTVQGPVWSTLVFSADSKRLYTMVDWGGPLRLTAFDVAPTGLVQTASALTGEGAKHLPNCGGPGLAARLLPDSKTLAAFCHFDGDLWFIDLATLQLIANVSTGQTNPFELSPIFTPDGQIVYLRGATTMRAVDIATRSLVGPGPTPRKLDQPGLFSWLFSQAAAGYIASTVPISPDGTKLYISGGDGITVLRVPDLKPLAVLAPGHSFGEVWISGDGKTVYAIEPGSAFYVMNESGGPAISVPVPQLGGYFIASEHG